MGFLTCFIWPLGDKKEGFQGSITNWWENWALRSKDWKKGQNSKNKAEKKILHKEKKQALEDEIQIRRYNSTKNWKIHVALKKELKLIVCLI